MLSVPGGTKWTSLEILPGSTGRFDTLASSLKLGPSGLSSKPMAPSPSTAENLGSNETRMFVFGGTQEAGPPTAADR